MKQKLYKNKEEENFEEELVLDPSKELFEEYIGVVITDLKTDKFDEEELFSNLVTKIITRVESDHQSLLLTLSKINGQFGGYLRITPTSGGQFVEGDSDRDLSSSSLYRLCFFGGDSIDYFSDERKGSLSFFNLKDIN